MTRRPVITTPSFKRQITIAGKEAAKLVDFAMCSDRQRTRTAVNRAIKQTRLYKKYGNPVRCDIRVAILKSFGIATFKDFVTFATEIFAQIEADEEI